MDKVFDVISSRNCKRLRKFIRSMATLKGIKQKHDLMFLFSISLLHLGSSDSGNVVHSDIQRTAIYCLSC